MAAAVGVTLGWPVAGAALLPFALYILVSPRLLRSFLVLFASLLLLLSAVALTDTWFYGRVTVRCSCLRGPPPHALAERARQRHMNQCIDTLNEVLQVEHVTLLQLGLTLCCAAHSQGPAAL